MGSKGDTFIFVSLNMTPGIGRKTLIAANVAVQAELVHAGRKMAMADHHSSAPP